MRRLALAAVLSAALTAPPAGAAEPVWVPTLPLPQQGTDLLSAFPNGTAYAEHTNGGDNLLFKSTDYGQTWSPVELPAAGGTVYVRFASPTTGYLLPFGGDHAYLTTDSGATWQRLKPFPAAKGERFVADTLAVHGRSVVVAGTLVRGSGNCNGSHGMVAVSDDLGRTWRRTVLPSPGSMTAGYSVRMSGRTVALVFYEEESDCATLYDANAVWVSHDGGRRFARRAVCPNLCTAVGIASRDRILVGRNDGTTAISEDGGRTFKEAQRFTDAGPLTAAANAFWVQSFTFVGRVGYASTKGGGTWRTTTAGYEWTQELSHEATYGLGIGEVAMFDADRAITGGPSAISTRKLV